MRAGKGGQWEQKLSRKQKEMFNMILSDELKQFAYMHLGMSRGKKTEFLLSVSENSIKENEEGFYVFMVAIPYGPGFHCGYELSKDFEIVFIGSFQNYIGT